MNSPCPAFYVAGDSTYSLAAGQTKTFDVQFFWQHADLHQCAINTGCGIVQCTATGGVSPCGVTPTTLDFGTVPLGSSVDRTFAVTNNGTDLFAVEAPDTCGDFRFTTNNRLYISPGETVQFGVRFVPRRAGAQSCAIPLRNICTPVLCTGTGQFSPCYVSPTELDFGMVTFGERPGRQFTIRNDGSTRLVGDVDHAFADVVCGSFVIEGDTQYDLAPGASRVFSVRFDPRIIAPELTCQAGTGTAPCAEMTYRGGVRAPESGSCPSVTLTPLELDFGSVTVGQSVTRTMHISTFDTCDWPGAQLVLNVAGPDFTFADGTRSRTIGIDATTDFDLQLRFAPTVTGEQSLAIASYRVCGPPGTAGFPCRVILGRGLGIGSGAARRSGMSAWKPPRQ